MTAAELPRTSAPAEDAADDAQHAADAGRAEATLVQRLNAALRVARLYALDHALAQQAIAELRESLEQFIARRGRVALLLADERVYVDGRLVRTGRAGRSWLDDFQQLLTRLGIGGLLFTGSWDPPAVRALVAAFQLENADGDPAGAVARSLSVYVLPPARVKVLDFEEAEAFAQDEEEGHLPERERATFYHARLMALAEATGRAIREQGAPDAYGRQVRQTVMKVIESLPQPAFRRRLLALTAAPLEGDERLAHQAAAVTALSLAAGAALGLERARLADLGFAAFHHDDGRVEAPARAAPGAREEDPDSALEHLLRGVRLGLRGQVQGQSGLLRLAVQLEHHRDTDHYPAFGGGPSSGPAAPPYPRPTKHAPLPTPGGGAAGTGLCSARSRPDDTDGALRPPHLFSRIVGAAELFARLEAGTPWLPPLSPAAALRALTSGRRRLDAAVAGLLSRVLGPLPRGSLVSEGQGGVALVVDGAPAGGQVLIQRVPPAGSGQRPGAPVWVPLDDLAERPTPGGAWRKLLLAAA